MKKWGRGGGKKIKKEKGWERCGGGGGGGEGWGRGELTTLHKSRDSEERGEIKFSTSLKTTATGK